jgi:YD repeat-containing protein
VSNGSSESGWLGPWWFTPTVAQPPVTSHLSGAPEGAEMPGVNPQVGNYATAATDATVTVAGPALSVTRTYNSQDLRTSGAFGAGWSTPWDQKVVTDADGSGNVVVTMASGVQTRFGHNPDGTYAPPRGQNLTLVGATSPVSWTLRDPSGYQRVFDAAGRLSSVVDADGRTQTYTYVGSELSTVTDVASGRALHVTWTGGHITMVATDVPGVGQPASTWTYQYTGNRLTRVYAPLSPTSYTDYGYTTSTSH